MKNGTPPLFTAAFLNRRSPQSEKNTLTFKSRRPTADSPDARWFYVQNQPAALIGVNYPAIVWIQNTTPLLYLLSG